MRFALIRLAADRHRLADQQSSSADGRLVGADPGAGAARGLCAAWQRGVAAAGDAVPRLSHLHRAAGPCGGTGGVAGGAGRARGGHAAGAAAGGPRAAGAGADRAVARCHAERFAQSRGARAGADAQHRDAGRVGHPARPAERPRRRGVRRDGGGPSGGACRRRAHGGAVHQHAAAADATAAASFRCRRCCGRPRTASRG